VEGSGYRELPASSTLVKTLCNIGCYTPMRDMATKRQQDRTLVRLGERHRVDTTQGRASEHLHSETSGIRSFPKVDPKV
jgi:hypothetical protein